MLRIELPGATTVTSGPWLEKPDTASDAVVDPTAITPGTVVEYAAGQMTGPPSSLPAALPAAPSPVPERRPERVAVPA